jgi:hypothetical protein
MTERNVFNRRAPWITSLVGKPSTHPSPSALALTTSPRRRFLTDRVSTQTGRSSPFVWSNTVCVTAIVLGLLVCSRDAFSQVTGPDGPAQYEQASVEVPAGATCLLHPAGNADPRQSIPVYSDEDGVARFHAVRPTGPNSVEQLELDCTQSDGSSKTYSVDLRLESTFAPRPFDPSRTDLKVRPALSGDPLSYTQEQLIQAGYGLRPDPIRNWEGYQRWLAAASVETYKLRRDPRVSLTNSLSRRRPEPEAAGPDTTPEIDATVYTNPSSGWVGAVLSGSYQKNATPDLAYSYIENEATFDIPTITPGGHGTGTTATTIWNGLDNVFQAIVDVNTTATAASFGIHHQCFGSAAHTGADTDNAGTRFTPNPGDKIYAQEWYCDAKGNLNLSGGHACTLMQDITQGVSWQCDQASSSDCPSYTLKAGDNLGFWADFIIENDTSQVVPGSHEWPDFSPVTMLGSALVVQGTGVSGDGAWVTTSTDPTVTVWTDNTTSTGRLAVTLPVGGVKWEESYTAPVVSTVNPASGLEEGGINVTVTGKNLSDAYPFKFGGSLATSVVCSSSSKCTMVNPAHAPGLVAVVVVSPLGNGTLADAFNYLRPVISKVSPSSGPLEGGTKITVTGKALTDNYTFEIGGSPATSVSCSSSSTCTMITPDHAPGSVAVAADSPEGNGTLANAFKYLEPAVTGFLPGVGPTVGGIYVQINGTSLKTGMTVDFGGESASSVSCTDSTVCTVTLPPHAAGAVNVTVTVDSYSSSPSSTTFTYAVFPTITGI